MPQGNRQHWLNSSKYLDFSADEKEKFEPSQFQESIIQGLNQTGTDLEAVAKFLDASGAKLDYRRYAETLFDILVAGGMLGKRQENKQEEKAHFQNRKKSLLVQWQFQQSII